MGRAFWLLMQLLGGIVTHGTFGFIFGGLVILLSDDVGVTLPGKDRWRIATPKLGGEACFRGPWIFPKTNGSGDGNHRSFPAGVFGSI